jgi:hypothetical protein
MMKIRALLIAVMGICAVVAVSGCGYSAKPTLPAHLKTIAVPGFDNRTFYVDLGNELTNAVRHKIRTDSYLTLSGDKNANCELTARIIRYDKVILRDNIKDETAEARVIITAVISLRDNVKGGFLFKDKEVQGSWTHLIPRGQDENYARANAVRDLAENIVNAVTYVW